MQSHGINIKGQKKKQLKNALGRKHRLYAQEQSAPEANYPISSVLVSLLRARAQVAAFRKASISVSVVDAQRSGRDHSSDFHTHRMASVWFPFMVLAGLGAADALSPESRGALGYLEPLFSVFQIPRGRAGGRAYVPVQIWKFLKGKDPSALAALFLGKGYSLKGKSKM